MPPPGMGRSCLQPSACAPQVAASRQRLHSRRAYDPHLRTKMVRDLPLPLPARSRHPAGPLPSSRRHPHAKVSFVFRSLQRLPEVQRYNSVGTFQQRAVQVRSRAVYFHFSKPFFRIYFFFLRRQHLLSSDPVAAAHGQVLSLVDCSVLDMGVLLLRRLLEDEKLHYAI